jgi:hypothetical protein
MRFEFFSVSFACLLAVFLLFVTHNRFPKRSWYYTVAFSYESNSIAFSRPHIYVVSTRSWTVNFIVECLGCCFLWSRVQISTLTQAIMPHFRGSTGEIVW